MYTFRYKRYTFRRRKYNFEDGVVYFSSNSKMSQMHGIVGHLFSNAINQE
jgi:hypothetical protein